MARPHPVPPDPVTIALRPWRYMDRMYNTSVIAYNAQSRMPIRLRNYQGPADLALQHNFWVSVTSGLPWCWKPTTSPRRYSQERQFDPRSRCFAFEGDRLIGYMSFTGEDDFISLEYPWVLPGYQGELQDELYRRVYGFAASSEYGGKKFAQRFRRPWTRQIEFFRERGFAEQRSEPIYALPVIHRRPADSIGAYSIEITPDFSFETFAPLSAGTLPPEQLRMFARYLETVDFDFALAATRRGEPAAYFGFTIRRDTGFAELIASAVAPAETEAISPALSAAVHELSLRHARVLATKLLPGDPDGRVLVELDFRKRTEEVFMFKEL